MIENNPKSVIATFEVLFEGIEAEIEFVNRAGARAFGDRDYDKAKKAIECAAQIAGFLDKVIGLRREWESLFRSEFDEEEVIEENTERRNLGLLPSGLRTLEEAYYRPMLEALQGLGGSAKTPQFLHKIFQKMKSVLRDVDYELLASDPAIPSWRNVPQWARYSMAKEGLLQSNSPRGVWAIRDKGVQFLCGHIGQQQVQCKGLLQVHPLKRNFIIGN